MPNLDNPITSFTTNSFVYNPTKTIISAVFAGMGFMFITIFLGAPIIVSMLALFSGILLVYGYRIGKVKYALYPFGIHQTIRRFIPDILGKEAEERLITWNFINSYKIDKDLSKSLKPYHFIKLYLNVSPKEIWITDQINKDGFDKFKFEFEKLIQEHENIRAENDFNPRSISNVEDIRPQYIKRKKGFYSTIFAKIVTLFFLVVSILLLMYAIKSGMRATNWFRLGVVIIPGTIYMVYRVFFEKKQY
jgi:hypothetical protein